MGYSTDFSGNFKITPALSNEHRQYLEKFAETRRMKRNPQLAETMDDPVRVAAGLPIGEDAEFFVGGTDDFGRGRDQSVVDYNSPPRTQPGLWCQWVPTEDGDHFGWDGGEKFYHYVEWLQYLIDKFLKHWGYTLDGRIVWQGEDRSDCGEITVAGNEVTSKELSPSEVANDFAENYEYEEDDFADDKE